MERAVKAAVIHRKRLIREGITHLLSQQHGITVVASAAEAYEILGEITKLRPDVVILNLRLARARRPWRGATALSGFTLGSRSLCWVSPN